MALILSTCRRRAASEPKWSLRWLLLTLLTLQLHVGVHPDHRPQDTPKINQLQVHVKKQPFLWFINKKMKPPYFQSFCSNRIRIVVLGSQDATRWGLVQIRCCWKYLSCHWSVLSCYQICVWCMNPGMVRQNPCVFLIFHQSVCQQLKEHWSHKRRLRNLRSGGRLLWPVGDGETGPLVAIYFFSWYRQHVRLGPAVLAATGGESGLAVVPSPLRQGIGVQPIFFILGQRWYTKIGCLHNT